MPSERKNNHRSHLFRVSPITLGPGPDHRPVLGPPQGPRTPTPLPSSPAARPGAHSTCCGLSLSFRKPFPWRRCKHQCGCAPRTQAFLVPELTEVGRAHLLGCPAGALWLPGSLAACVVHTVTPSVGSYSCLTRSPAWKAGPRGESRSWGTVEGHTAPQEDSVGWVSAAQAQGTSSHHSRQAFAISPFYT